MTTRIDQLKASIKAKRAETRINQRVYNMAERALLRSVRELDALERKLADKLAKAK